MSTRPITWRKPSTSGIPPGVRPTCFSIRPTHTRCSIAVFGWPSLWVSLPVVAWLGRVLVWGLFAWGWQRLSWSILPRRYVSLLSAAWFLVLNDYCHLAGEWAVGGLEAKGIAYACVLCGLHALVRQRWTRGLDLAGCRIRVPRAGGWLERGGRGHRLVAVAARATARSQDVAWVWPAGSRWRCWGWCPPGG